MIRTNLKAYRSWIPRSGLIAEYTMDEVSGATLYDTSGNENYMTISNASQVPGILGKAINFNGVATSYAQAQSPVIPMGAKSISFFAMTTNLASGAVLANRNSTEGGTLIRLLNNSLGFLFTPDSVQVAASMDLYKVIHFCVTWNGTTDFNAVKLYKDGVLAVQGQTVLEESSAALNLRIGARPNGSGPWAGTIEQLRIYNRVLSADEVSALANEYR